ncbi:tetratricopeptide repeat protein [Actinoplanes sp. LDG1-06]|uniref:Tetratricopeptide repeat protein n=1 Tax=Paractinoplanes ovalisporus TaxID=2810368 RepID=A0ABS2A8M4_9ACTN|nr:tetratricopeptide repeat protein [Actinoplanes ovalisporus]MBM2615576.1 tetratricopeptide repeat protein [Actinoplanes ovalisporus]
MPLAFDHIRRQARSLAESGDTAGARSLLENAVEQGRPALRDGDPELLETMRQLAGLHHSAGDPMGARRVLEEAAAAGERLGDADPLGVMLAYDLAVVAEELANRHVARSNFVKVASFGPGALGEDHWAVARARSYLDAAAPTPPVSDAPSSVPPVSGAPTSVPPVSAVPASAPPASPPPLFAPPPTSVPPAAPAFEPTPPSRGRRTWLPAALGGVAGGIIVAVVVAVFLLRPTANPETTSAAPTAPASAVVVPTASAALPAPLVPSASAPAAAATTTPPAASAPAATRPPTTAPPTATKTTAPPPAVRTRIVAPANNSRVAYPFDAEFTVSAADVSAPNTVVALLICVAGRCYLDGKLDIIGTGAAPYTIYLGSTRPEGTGVAWKLRLDRLPKAKFNDLIAQRDAAIADGSWGDKGTPMSALNPTPVSTLTVVKG